MNTTITEGLVLTPPAFDAGLDVWSSEDGTPGSATYDGATNAALVVADSDFGGCLELTKTEATQKLRYMGETPIMPGCYLRITARVKAVTGNLPSVQIAAWAGDGSNLHVTGLTETGPVTALAAYGVVYEVSAIVGTGTRTGVDMPWGLTPVYGHFGLDLTGSNGGIVRIDDIEIEDVTSAFLRDMMDWVDVRDYGAIGDGVTDDIDAFNAADDAAAGRTVLVPDGTYFLGANMTFENRVRFSGKVTMADANRLVVRQGFNLDTYIDAFGEEVLAFKKAFQALLNFTDHESLDMCGRRLELTEPIDMQAAVDNADTFEIRRVIRNGQFNVQSSTSWDTGTQTSTADYDANNPLKLTNVSNIANIEVGSLVTGTGVGREVYVNATNVGAGELTLSQPLYAAPSSQSYTFDRFRYALDFSKFVKLSKMTITDVDFQCNGHCSGILMAPAGETFQVKDCAFTKPKDRGITSHGTACQDLQIDRCHFTSNEQSTPATDRVSLGFNVNANDAKIRDSRFQRLGTTGVLHGSGHILVGNHWFQGDSETAAPRVAGLVLTEHNTKTIITGNYIDNCSIELTNEHDPAPDFASEYSFGALTITGNIFYCSNAASWFSFIVVKPHGIDHFIQGLSVTGNIFRTANTNIERVDKLDDSIATLDLGRMRNVVFSGNTFNGVDQPTINPSTLEFEQASDEATWTLNVSGYLPFGGRARVVEAVVAKGEITNASDVAVHHFPAAVVNAGVDQNYVQLKWPEPVKGTVQITSRVDNPY